MSDTPMRTLLFALSLAVVLPQTSAALDAGATFAIPAASQQRLSTAKFSTVMPIATVGANTGLFDELQKHVDPNSVAIVIESGSFTLAELAKAVAEKQLAHAFQKQGGVFYVTAPLVIWKGAELRIDKGESVFLDGTKSALILNAGTLMVTEASIDASASSDAGNPFRPFVLSVADGGASVTDSSIRNLGFGAFAETSGLSFLGRGFSLATPNIRVVNNRIADLLSLSFIKSGSSVVTGNHLRDMRASGIVLQSVSNVEVSNNQLLSTNGNGIRVTSRSQQVKLQGNDIQSSKAHGIFVDDGSVMVAVNANRVEKSGLSGIVIKGSGCSTVSNNTSANNMLSGIRAEASFDIELSGNSITKNHDGITLEQQAGAISTAIRGNALSRNAVGIRSDGYGDLSLSGNDFSAQWPRLFAGEIAGATGQYLGAQAARQNSEFVLNGEQKPATVQLASFSAYGLAACNK